MCFYGVSPAQEVRDLIIVAGQSNAVGFDADRSELPQDAADRDVLFWWRCGDPPPDEYDSICAGWTHLQPQPRGNPNPDKSIPRQYGNFRFDNGGFGPEIGLARTLAKVQHRPVAIAKVAFSGTGISTDWDPKASGERGLCYRALIAEVKKAVSAAESDGITLCPRALIWVQGESDASAGKAAAYESNLINMISALRGDLSAPGLPVLLGVNTKFGGAGRMEKVINAQKAAAEHIFRCVYVDTSGATVANNAHFDAAGTLEAGRRFAEALVQNNF